MFLNLFKRNEYFIVVELPTERSTSVPKSILKWAKKYFWWRRKNVSYFEPHTSKLSGKHCVVIGTPDKPAAIKRTSMIFLLELYAHLENKNIPISFPKKTIEKDGLVVHIYKIPNKI